MAMLDVVTAFFEEQGWPTSLAEASKTLTFQFEGDNGRWACLAHVLEEQRQLVFFSIYPGNVPLGRRASVAEFLTRANYHLSVGNLEMDFEDGEVRFRTSIDVEEQELTLALVGSVVYINIVMTDHFYPGLMAVAYAGSSPVEAITALAQRTSSISP